MFKISSPATYAFAAVMLLGGLTAAGPVFARGASSSVSSDSSPMDQSAGGKRERSPEAMAEHVENRIKTLHSKLKITPDQETAWNDVAQAMRDNEANVSQLIQERHQNAKNMTAVDDLASYQKIAQAHADGMTKMISAFQSLYDNMSDEQKKNADEVFGRFEGHRGMMKASSMKKGSTKGGSAPMNEAPGNE